MMKINEKEIDWTRREKATNKSELDFMDFIYSLETSEIETCHRSVLV